MTNDKKVKINMAFDNALKKSTTINLDELAKVKLANIDESKHSNYYNSFEECVHKDKNGVDFWYARDLQKLFGYSEWRKFENVIQKAITSIKTYGKKEENHFVHVDKMVNIGSETKRKIQDYRLTRLACYLIAMNGDPRKVTIAYAQQYFAEQSRKMEVIEQRIKDFERIDSRYKLRETESEFSALAYQRGANEKDFGIIRSKGDNALFGGYNTAAMKKRLRIKRGALADYLPDYTITAKTLINKMTNYGLKTKHHIYGEHLISTEHIENSKSIRNALLERGYAPEDQPAEEDINKIEKRYKKETKKIFKNNNVEQLDSHQHINLTKDLWKYALFIMSTQANGVILTKDLISTLEQEIKIEDYQKEKLQGRKDSKFTQLIRNLKSHKNSKTNFIYQGYAEDIKDGFKITQKGLKFVEEEFKEYQ